MRTPRLRDAGQWSATRLACRRALEPAFPAFGSDWAAEQDETAWVQRWWRMHRGGGMPFVLWLDGVLIGELGVDAVEWRTGTGELSAWGSGNHGHVQTMRAALRLVCARAFCGPDPLDRLVSPVSVHNPGPIPALRERGFVCEARIPAMRHTSSGLADHDIWVLHNTAALRRQLTAELQA